MLLLSQVLNFYCFSIIQRLLRYFVKYYNNTYFDSQVYTFAILEQHRIVRDIKSELTAFILIYSKTGEYRLCSRYIFSVIYEITNRVQLEKLLKKIIHLQANFCWMKTVSNCWFIIHVYQLKTTSYYTTWHSINIWMRWM